MLCGPSQYGLENKIIFIHNIYCLKIPMIHYTPFPLLIPNFPWSSFLNLNKLHETHYHFFPPESFYLFRLPQFWMFAYRRKKKPHQNPTTFKKTFLRALTPLLFQNESCTIKGSPSSWCLKHRENVWWVLVAQKQDVNLMRLQKVFNFLVLRSPF